MLDARARVCTPFSWLFDIFFVAFATHNTHRSIFLSFLLFPLCVEIHRNDVKTIRRVVAAANGSEGDARRTAERANGIGEDTKDGERETNDLICTVLYHFMEREHGNLRRKEKVFGAVRRGRRKGIVGA